MAYSQCDMDEMDEEVAAVERERDQLEEKLARASQCIAEVRSALEEEDHYIAAGNISSVVEKYDAASSQHPTHDATERERIQLDAVIKERDEWRKKWEDLEIHRASCCEQMERERDTACAIVLELEKKLAEARYECTEQREAKEAAYTQIYKAMEELKPNVPASGLLDACKQRMQAFISERDNADAAEHLLSQLRADLALRTTERDDWERACHNREDDLRSARHEAERYAAEAEDWQQAAMRHAYDLAAAMKVVEAVRKNHDPSNAPPGTDCLMCSGEACALCGAGCASTDPNRPRCEHDVIERHQELQVDPKLPPSPLQEADDDDGSETTGQPVASPPARAGTSPRAPRPAGKPGGRAG